LSKLPSIVRNRLGTKIEALAEEPRPGGAKKLKGTEGTYRVRSGDYRILYTIADDVLLVVVVTVGDRKDVYDHI
jgi:mRNA interferase RelE/StbE